MTDEAKIRRIEFLEEKMKKIEDEGKSPQTKDGKRELLRKFYKHYKDELEKLQSQTA